MLPCRGSLDSARLHRALEAASSWRLLLEVPSVKILARTSIALALYAAIVVLSGCGGSQAGTPVATQPSGTVPRHPHHGRRASSNTEFTVSGRTILVDGQPLYIKGVDYMNTQIDADSDPNPLDNANEKLWGPDLDAMRAAGVNAVKVYNVSLTSFKPYLSILGDGNKLKGYETGKIDKFLDRAWNNGDHPIYVILSIYFGGDNVLDPPFLRALTRVYGLTASDYGSYPALMGFSLGSEINSESLIKLPNWWKGLNEISDAISDGYRVNKAKKIITTTMVDMVRDRELATVVAGEQNNFKIDAWGIDSYRGYTFTDIWKQIKDATQKPEIMAEYGSSAGWWTQSSATYDTTSHVCPKDTYPAGSFNPDDKYKGLPPGPPPPWEFVKELPKNGNPNMQNLVDQVTSNAKELYANSTAQGGVGSGGFYFEWNDEWAKAGWPHLHIGGFPGNVISPTPPFAGCYWDEAWFGLTEDHPIDRQYKWPDKGNPFPARPADKHVPRPTLDAIKAVWSSE